MIKDGTNIVVALIVLMAFGVMAVAITSAGERKKPDNIKIIYSGDYQLDVDEDSIYLSDKGRKIGTVALDSTTAIGKLILSDNEDE